MHIIADSHENGQEAARDFHESWCGQRGAEGIDLPSRRERERGRYPIRRCMAERTHVVVCGVYHKHARDTCENDLCENAKAECWRLQIRTWDTNAWILDQIPNGARIHMTGFHGALLVSWNTEKLRILLGAQSQVSALCPTSQYLPMP